MVEAGGITQKLSAFRVRLDYEDDREVVFLDTPGHAAFSTMRSHGVNATDLVVLVVALDDGVKSQTREALRTAKNSGSTIIVAINKIDKILPGPAREAAKSKIYAALSEEDLICEEFGGNVMAVEVSAQSGDNLDSLVESLLLQADVMELEAAEDGQCEAIVLDANMEKGRGCSGCSSKEGLPENGRLSGSGHYVRQGAGHGGRLWQGYRRGRPEYAS